MPIHYAVGQALVSDEELREKQHKQNFDFTQAAQFESGNFVPEATGEPLPFEPIGVGKPLIVEIREIYTGKFPGRRSKDLLVTSAMKSIAAFNGAPRAINYMHKDVQRYQSMDVVPAVENGTPLIFYSPALTQKNSTITIEFGFDEFNEQAFETVGGLFQDAAGVPLFAPASNILLAASGITRIIGRIGELLGEKRQVFRSSEPLNLLRAGDVVAKAGFALLTDERNPMSKDDRSKYQIDKFGKLVDSTGTAYAGDTPYAIISYDGREMREYEDFSPTQASAEILDRFYSIGRNSDEGAKIIFDSLKLLSDQRFRSEADDLAKEISELDPTADAEKIARLTMEREALIKNITNDLFKPKDGGSA